MFVEGGGNRFPAIDGVRRQDGTIIIDVTIHAPCRGAEDDGRKIFVVLLPTGDEGVEVARTTKRQDCGPVPPA